MIARTYLAKLGVNANDEINGVFLEFRKKGVTKLGQGTIHNNIYTNTYYAEIIRIVLVAKNKEQVKTILQKIAKELENNTFPY